MSNITLSPALVARSFDTNRNGQVSDELKLSKDVTALLDSDKNGQVSVAELAAGLEKDRIILSEGAAKLAKGKLAAPAAGGFDAQLAKTNQALFRAELDLQELQTAIPAKLPTALAYTTQRQAGATAYYKAVSTATRYDRTPREQKVLDDLSNLSGRCQNQLGQLRGMSTEPRLNELSTLARSAYDAGVAAMEAGDDQGAVLKAGVSLERVGTRATEIGASIARDKKLLDNPAL